MPANPKAKYEITADDKTAAAWRSAMRTADSAGKQISNALKTAFAGVSVAALGSALNQAIEFGDEIGKLSVKTGLGATALSELAYAAKMSDIELDSLSTALRKMQVNTSLAATGNKQLQETFSALGIKLSDFRSLKADQQFERIADAISQLRDPADRARAVTELLGKAGADLLPMFEDGAKGIQKARIEAHEFGLALTDIDVQKLQEADDALKGLTARMDALKLAAASGWPGDLAAGIADGFRKIAGGATEIEILENQLRILRETSESIPVFFNFGFVDGAGLILGPSEIKATMDAIEGRVIRLKEKSGSLGRNAGPNKRYRGGQVRRDEPPGYETATESAEDKSAALERRQAILDMEQWYALSNSADRSTQEWMWSTIDLEGALLDLPEPILQLSDSLVQAQAVQEEFSRSMFNNFSDLFMSIGTGSDDMAEQFLNTLKRMLSDQATLKLFELLGGAGNSMAGSSGWAGAVGAGLSAMFGGTRDSGGRGNPGMAYEIGTGAQPELFVPDSPGTFYPRGALGGGGANVKITTNIDARNSTADSMKMLPAILKQHGESLKVDIITGLQRRKYRI